MSKDGISRIPDILRRCERELLVDWMEQQLSADTLHRDLIKDAELQEQSREFLTIFREAVQNGNLAEIGTSEWAAAREFLSNLSQLRAQQGFSPTETATFVFSLKQPLYDRLCQEYGRDTDGLVNDLWTATTVLDKLGLYTTEVFQKTREGVIGRQQQELLELSTPVVELWENILALPLIGTLDSARTQVVMESLLQKIVESGSSIAIIDITGVPTVDTLVAQHLLKTVAAARLMGADCIISGIRPEIAQTVAADENEQEGREQSEPAPDKPEQNLRKSWLAKSGLTGAKPKIHYYDQAIGCGFPAASYAETIQGQRSDHVPPAVTVPFASNATARTGTSQQKMSAQDKTHRDHVGRVD